MDHEVTSKTPGTSSEKAPVEVLKTELMAISGFCSRKWRTPNLNDRTKQGYIRAELDAIGRYGDFFKLTELEAELKELRQIVSCLEKENSFLEVNR